MLKAQDTILVVANKWIHLDPDGKPQGAVLRDFIEDGPGWLGAQRDGKTGRFTFTDRPVKARATRYTRDRIVRGEVFLASREHAFDLGISQFEEPDALLVKAKAAAVAEYDDQHGAGAWARLNEPAPEPTVTQQSTDSTADGKKAARKTSAPTE